MAYAINSGATGTISAFSIDGETGALSAIGTPLAAGATPAFVAVAPSKAFAWVTASGSDAVFVYAIDPSTGGLTAAGSSATNSSPRSIAIDPAGRFAYITHWGADYVSKSEIDPTTGAFTWRATYATGNGPWSIDLDPAGKYAYVANHNEHTVSAYAIDLATGDLTSIGSPLTTDATPFDVTVDPSGEHLYVACSRSPDAAGKVATFAIGADGSLTALTGALCGWGPWSVAVDPAGRFAYTANADTYSNNVSGFVIDQGTGVLTAIVDGHEGQYDAGEKPVWVAADPTGKFLFVANNAAGSISTFAIDSSSGTLTTVGGVATGNPFSLLTVEFPVP